MQLGKIKRATGEAVMVLVEDGKVYPLDWHMRPDLRGLSELLAAPDPCQTARDMIDEKARPEPLAGQKFVAPVDRQEIWAAGVTYKRSKVAREEESKGAARFYDMVYTADRPELFLKATPQRVVGPGDTVRIRADGKWNVPEPELALVVSPAMKIVGYTIGNDMSSRDIEGENPLYLPQAKVYRKSCAIGPLITPFELMPPLHTVEIHLTIRRGASVAFEGKTDLSQMARTPDSLVDWLGRENEFPDGAILLTGTGVVPPDEFTLKSGDDIAISIDGIGTLNNRVE
jgi:2-dehydro-3-deoxy-D-arabinonate dehydratase